MMINASIAATRSCLATSRKYLQISADTYIARAPTRLSTRRRICCVKIHDFRRGESLLSPHERSTIRKLRLVPIVRPTEHPNILDRGSATFRERLDVVELEERALGTAMTIDAHERTSQSIASRDFALHRGRNVPRVIRGHGSGLRLLGRGEFFL